MKKGRKVKLLKHEQELVKNGELQNVTHPGSTSTWLLAPSGHENEEFVLVYRPMGDLEILHLVQHGQLPSTQPYQAIMEGEAGREYSFKYLNGQKKVDTHPTTVVEFCISRVLLEEIKNAQMKIEDGVMSVGLGNKGGGQLHKFNEALLLGDVTYRIVHVKRS